MRLNFVEKICTSFHALGGIEEPFIEVVDV